MEIRKAKGIWPEVAKNCHGGDISLCKKGHSHGFKAVDNCVLIVVGGNKEG